MEVPQDLLAAAERKLAKLEAFLDESGWVEVGFVEEQNPRISEKFHCEIVAHVKGHRLKVEGSAGEPLSALERATDKVDRQIRRLKDKRVTRRLGRGYGTAAAGSAPVEGNGEAARAASVSGERVARRPAFVVTAEADGKPMTPLEATMQLDMSNEPFLLFLNAETDRPAVVYRVGGGDYGLVEMPA